MGRRRSHLSPQTVSRIREMREDGCTYTEIATGLNLVSARGALRTSIVTRYCWDILKPAERFITALQDAPNLEKIRDKRKRGMAFKDITEDMREELGFDIELSYATSIVRDLCKEHGFCMGTKKRVSRVLERRKAARLVVRKDLWADAVAARRAGATLEEIASDMGVTKQRVHQMMRRFGVPWSPRKKEPHPCAQCEASIPATSHAKYCSDACRSQGIAEVWRQKESKWSRLKGREMICWWCHEKFDRTEYQDSISKSGGSSRTFCSTDCYHAARRHAGAEDT